MRFEIKPGYEMRYILAHTEKYSDEYLELLTPKELFCTWLEDYEGIIDNPKLLLMVLDECGLSLTEKKENEI